MAFSSTQCQTMTQQQKYQHQQRPIIERQKNLNNQSQFQTQTSNSAMLASQKSQHYSKSITSLDNGLSSASTSNRTKPTCGQENLSETINISKMAISATPFPRNSLKVLNCRVSRANSWLQALRKTSCPILLRVYGRLQSMSDLPSTKHKGVNAKIILVSDLSDPSQRISCVFHEIDRKIEAFRVGDNIVVSGQHRTTRKDFELHIFSVDAFNPQDTMPYLPRIENFALRSLKTILNPWTLSEFQRHFISLMKTLHFVKRLFVFLFLSNAIFSYIQL